MPRDPADAARVRRLGMPLPVLSVEEAARVLPLREADARAWLAAEGLIRLIRGRKVVSWAAVLDRLTEAPPATRGDDEPSPRARVLALPRLAIPDRRRKAT